MSDSDVSSPKWAGFALTFVIIFLFFISIVFGVLLYSVEILTFLNAHEIPIVELLYNAEVRKVFSIIYYVFSTVLFFVTVFSLKVMWGIRFKGKFGFDYKKNFFSNKIVLLFIYILVGPAIIMSMVTTLNLIVDLKASVTKLPESHMLLSFLWKYYKEPIYLVGMLGPVLGLLSINYKSELSIFQIERLEEQNIFSNYYKHLEEFEKYCNAKFPDKKISIVDCRRVHSRVFPKSQDGELHNVEDAVKDLEEFIIAFLRHGVNLNTRNNASFYKAYYSMCDEMFSFLSMKGMSVGHVNIAYIAEHNGKKISIEGVTGNLSCSIQRFLSICFTMKTLLAFSHKYVPSELLKTFPRLKPDFNYIYLNENDDVRPFDILALFNIKQLNGTFKLNELAKPKPS